MDTLATLIFWPLLAVELIVFATWLWATVTYGRDG